MLEGVELVSYALIYTKQAQKDAGKLKAAGLKDNALLLLDIIRTDPYQTPPAYERLVGDLTGLYSRRINVKHRLVYHINEDIKTVKILRMWSHYE